MKKIVFLLAVLNCIYFLHSYTCMAQVPTAGLIGEWTFTGNANDGSGNSHHGTVYGGATLTTDRFGSANSAYSFNGTDAFIELGTWFNYQEFSISLWVNRNSVQNYQYVDIIDNNHTDFRSWTIQERYGYYGFGPCFPTPFTLTDNTWVHLVVTHRSTEDKLYLDGDLIVTAPCNWPINYDGTQHLGLARWYGDNGGQTRFWKGKIDDVLIYNRVLSVGEVSTLYRQGVTFTGGGGDNLFSNSNNWDPVGVPATNVDIIIAPGATMVVNMDYTCKTLTINAGASFGCSGGFVLTITAGVYDGNGKKVIDIGSSLRVGSGLVIPNPEPTSGMFTDSRDGLDYNWVKIGTQIWMAENLAFNNDGGCWAYNNDEGNVATYGRLYTWPTAQGVCPSGWHLPSEAEWTELTDFLGGESVAGGKLKEAGTTHWSPNSGATNETGFSAIPGGHRWFLDGTFEYIGIAGYWWSSAEALASWVGNRNMSSYQDIINRGSCDKVLFVEEGFSVRCVKN